MIALSLDLHIYIMYMYAFEGLAYICCFKKYVVFWNIYKNNGCHEYQVVFKYQQVIGYTAIHK